MEAVPALDRIVVVLGAHADEILSRVDLGVGEPVVCREWAQGLSASLRCGIDALAGERAYIITLGDQPFVTVQAIARLVDEPGTCRASYDGEPGHPVRLTAAMARRARNLTGDEGARELLRDCRLIECGHLSQPADVDTPEQLEALRA